MSAAWPSVALGSVVSLDVERVPIDASKAYPMVGVLSFGRGLFDREPIENGATSYKCFYRLKSDHIVMSQLFGWEGALALSDEKFAGKYLSPQFPTFLSDQAKLDRNFLGWLMRRPTFWSDLGSRASGMGDRRRTLNPDAFFACKIPLPPLDEQRRILARIEELAAKVEEARKLNASSLVGGSRLLSAMAHRADLSTEAKLRQGWQRAKLEDLLTEYRDPYPVLADASYPNFGIYSFGRGLFTKPHINGLGSSATQLFRARAGLFIYSRLFAFEGAYGLVEDEYDGYFVSNEYPMFVCNENRVLPEFLIAYLLPSTIWREIANGSGGLGDRRQRVQPQHFLKHELLLPPLDWQQKIKNIRNRLVRAIPLQAETARELDAMLPAILDKAFKGEL